ncbi:MAG: hypothetical protein HY681_12270, partial [Chloroflexi bacterium]|nr:hypothetical protein [Chloroflexota bacterium]
SKSATQWVIGAMAFKVDANTRIDQGIEVGATVKVEFVMQADGSRLARKIERDTSQGAGRGGGEGRGGRG